MTAERDSTMTSSELETFLHAELEVLRQSPMASRITGKIGDYERAQKYAKHLATRNAQHSDDVAVEAFATAMKLKLAEARAKGRGGWDDKSECSQQDLSDMLRKHIDKGDPRDVANFCMFLYMRGEAIIPTHDAVVSDEEVANAWDAFHMYVDDRDASMRAALESRASRKVAVPAGYVLVPVEPTEAMVYAGASSHDYPSVFMGGPSEQGKRMSKRIYKAMLAQRDGG